MTYLTPVAILLGFIALAGALAWSRPRQAAPQAAPAPVPDKPPTALEGDQLLWGKVNALAVDLAELKIIVAGLPGLYEEQADRAHRAAEREEKAARRDRKRHQVEAFEPDDGELPAGDAHGGEGSRVPPPASSCGQQRSRPDGTPSARAPRGRDGRLQQLMLRRPLPWVPRGPTAPYGEGTTVIGYEPLNPEQYARQRALQNTIHVSNELRNELAALARRAAYMTRRQLAAYIKSRPLLR